MNRSKSFLAQRSFALLIAVSVLLLTSCFAGDEYDAYWTGVVPCELEDRLHDTIEERIASIEPTADQSVSPYDGLSCGPPFASRGYNGYVYMTVDRVDTSIEDSAKVWAEPDLELNPGQGFTLAGTFCDDQYELWFRHTNSIETGLPALILSDLQEDGFDCPS